MSLFAHGKSLEAALHEEHPDTKKIERRMEFFEAYAAQLQIPGSDEE